MKRSASWLLLCGLHGVGSMLLWWVGEPTLERLIWRVDTWTSQPWTLWSSAWVHLNTPQLILNQFALGALTAFAWVLRPPLSATLAWCLAWPLSQLVLPMWPQIGYAVGLSGVLHAGMAVLSVWLLARWIAVPKSRRWGALLGAALLIKLLVEQAWSQPVVWDNGSNMSVVQAIHLSAVAWGFLLGAAAVGLRRQRWPAVSRRSGGSMLTR